MTSAGGASRPYPTGADYSEALRDTAACFAHPVLARGLVAMGPLRMPRVVSGNFGSVFRVTGVGGPASGGVGGGAGGDAAGGREYAVKCFTRAVPDRLRRYRAIADALRTVEGTWRVDVDFVPRGVLVHGRWYPVVLMEWVDGSGLVPWLTEHLGDRAAIESLADQFARAVGDLERGGLAHGDLQHGNIVIGRDGVLRLIDYDGMYAPALASLGPAENGHRNYQHPARGTADFGPGLDRFSAHVIHLSLRVLAREPWLWQTYHDEGGEHLLLRAEDLASPAASERFAVVSGTCPELAGEFARLAYWAGRPPAEVGALGEPITATGRMSPKGLPAWLAEAARSPRDREADGAGDAPPRGAAAGTAADPAHTAHPSAPQPPQPPQPSQSPPVPTPVSAPPLGPADGTAAAPLPRSPSRARSRPQSPPRSQLQPESHAPSQPQPQLQPQTQPRPRPSGFSSLSRRTRWTVRLALAALLALSAAAVACTLLLFAVGVWILAPAFAAFAAAAGTGLAAHGRLHRAYRATPEVRRHADATIERERAGDHVMDALRRLTDHDEALRAAEKARADHAANRFAASGTLRARYDDECEGIGRRLAEALASVDRRREALEGSGPREEAQALRELHDRALRDGLAGFPLPTDLLGARIVAQLGREGVLTAADFVRVTSAVPTSPHLRSQATVSRPGRTVRVEGISPALARRLQEWRDEIVEELRLHLPATLPYQAAQELHRKRADQRIDLARQAARVRARALGELTALETEFEAAERDRRRTADHEAARLDAALGAAEQALKWAQRTYDQALHRAATARDVHDALAALTYRRFLRDALLGP
ncbi:hypothetical protein LO772_09600 [Yinghuangia sp. ASG 101]|uniref:hypothetical protein n=1 Tax=Yinghuangia sp. ASG 101 TaxID=2896848 RepID=UPI001E550FF9|nr:hypothetical protein [Yinghuangia sp. ASG 101]UGQ13818.1 hypothetical protein LO772_09600 [Yinghuangia sp. ASG 101]